MAATSNLTREIADLQQRLLRLAELVDRAVIGATWALANGEVAEAQHVVDGDDAIDAQRYALEAHATRLLCEQHLMAPDVRLVSGTLLLAGELERIGDYARGIASLVLRSANLAPQAVPPALSRMAHGARDMFQHAMRAVVQQDSAASHKIARADIAIDQAYQNICQELFATMQAHPEQSEWATYLLWVGHNLERTADRAVNIAERAAFIATGALGPTRH
jgi:phosphate transport system protein